MRARTLALLTCSLLGCGDCGDPPTPRAANNPAPLEATEPVAKDEPAFEPSPEDGLRPGFTPISVENDVPLCVFEDERARAQVDFPEQAEKQRLKAGSSVMIGAYAPWCVNEACDDRPSLQCWVEREGNTLVVHTRYWGDRKDEAKCENTVCRPITAGCATPPLEKGVYTVKQGDIEFELRIPSVLDEPCFATEPRVPPW